MDAPGGWQAPLLWLAAAFAAGCALGAGPPWAWMLAALVCMVLVRFIRVPVPRALLWVICFTSLGSGMRASVDARARETQAQVAQLSAMPGVTWEGVVRRVLREDGIGRILVHVEKAHAPDGVRALDVLAAVNVPAVLRPPAEGSRVLFKTALRAPRPSAFPGDFDAALTLGSHGIELTGSVHLPAHLAIKADDPGAEGLERVILHARGATRALIRGSLPDDAAALTEAFVLGDSALLTDELRRPFDASGASHLLAVSGLQATLLAALLFALLRLVWGRIPPLLARADAGPAAALLCLPLIFLYAAYAGGASSVMRSAWMAAAVMVAQAVRRKGALPQGLGAAAMLMLALEPRAVHDAGFLLSFLSVLALSLVAPGLVQAFKHRAENENRAFLLAAVASSAAAYVATLPLVAHLFGRLAVYGALTNVLLVPLGAIALPAVVIVTLLGTLLSSSFLVEVAGAVSIAVMQVCDIFAQIPGALVEVPPPPQWLVGVGLLGAVLMGLQRVKAGTVLVVVGALGGLIPRPNDNGTLRILMAPVGQGDGAILLTPKGDAVVIDAGGSFISHVDPGKTVMMPILKSLGVTQLSAVILSHPHPDHQNGLVTLVEEFAPKELWWNGQSSRHPRFAALMEAAARKGTRIITYDRPADGGVITRELGGATFTIMHPLPERDGEDAPRYFPEFGENDNSLVIRIGVGETHALFPGDIERDAELLLTETRAPFLRAQILKIPHHGSITSTSEMLLDAVRPEHALMGVGTGNPWGFPHPDVMARLGSHGIHTWRTDEDGLITAVLDGKSVTVHAYRR